MSVLQKQLKPKEKKTQKQENQKTKRNTSHIMEL